MKEEIIVIDPASINGILTYPDKNIDQGLPLIVLLNAGLIHKIGPNRIYVTLARRLAEEGYMVFRCDYGGRGDTLLKCGYADRQYLCAILDFLQKKNLGARFVPVGICSGADSAFHAACVDNRIEGLVMINGTGLSYETYNEVFILCQKRIQARYYRKALISPVKWIRLLSGKSNIFKGLFEKSFFRRRKILNSDKEEMSRLTVANPFDKLIGRNIEFFLITTEGSIAYDMMEIILSGTQNGSSGIEYTNMRGVDHVITPRWAQEELINGIECWLNKKFKKVSSNIKN